MCIIGISCRRRGTSTIYGVMIFVGIMFTAVIPMLLVMNQANTFQEIKKIEVGRLDEERAIENIFFHLETSKEFNPETEKDEPIITLVFYNRCVIAVKIVHVWINDELREVDYLIPPTSDGTLVIKDFVDYDTQVPVSFSVKVVTDKGNIFLSSSGNPEYSYDLESGLGSWKHDVYTIYIMMTEKRNQLHALVVFDPGDSDIIIFDDGLENNLPGYWITVPFEGNYQILVTQSGIYDPPLFYEQRLLGPPDKFKTLVII